MTFDALVERLAGSEDPTSRELVDDVKSGQVQPVLPGPGRDGAKSLGATFAIRAKTSEAAGIRTEGLAATVTRLNALVPQAQVLLFHFSGSKRVYSVFLQEADEQVVGVVMVERRSES